MIFMSAWRNKTHLKSGGRTERFRSRDLSGCNESPGCRVKFSAALTNLPSLFLIEKAAAFRYTPWRMEQGGI